MTITVGSLGRLQQVKQKGTDLVFSFDSSDLVLNAVLPNVIRHTWVPTHWRLYAEPVRASHVAARRFWPAGPPPLVRESTDEVEVQMGDCKILATREPFHLRYSLANGDVVLEEVKQGGLSWSYWDYSLRYVLSPEDQFYGMGQVDQLSAEVDLNHRGHLREVWNQHSPPAVTIFPSVLSLRGYALLVDNPCRATWDLGYTDPRSFSYRARGGGLQYYVILGPELPRILHSLLELTGYPPLPPRWTLGLLQSRYGYGSRQELEEIASQFRSRQLPCDALILDVFWFREMGDLAFDPQRWPQAGEMIKGLKRQGFRTVVIEEPYLTRQSQNYPEAQRRGYLARHYDGSTYTFDFWPGQCALLDFTNPAARNWWTEQHRPLLEMGIDGWWADLNEPSKHPQDMAHHGGSAEAVHNLYPLLMQQAISAAYERYAPGRRTFILSRSAYAGSQRYGVGWWSGDVERTFAALRKQVAVGLSAGLAGIPLWSSDVGGYGFAGECTPELYVRWFQFGAFTPLLRPHGDENQKREPWQFGSQVEAICRMYLRLRYRLLPYIYTLAREASSSGTPLMRPVIMEFPGDAAASNLADQYLFGPDILVAPVTEADAVSRPVYLPAATWSDFWTGARVQGPCTIEAAAPLDRLPLYIREGAIVPMGPDLQYSGELPLDPLTLAIYPASGRTRSFTLYEDDGESTDYRAGAFAQTRFDVAETDGTIRWRAGARAGGLAIPSRTLLLEFHHCRQPRQASWAGASLPAAPSLASLHLMPAGAFWHRERALMIVKLPDDGAPSSLTLA